MDRNPGVSPTLDQAMRYSLLDGGKRLRAILVYATGESFGAPIESLDALAAAVEMIHAFSLIHDDLPSMDDDDWRRGKPTCHKVYGEATAILAGDALHTMAFDLLAEAKGLSDKTKIALIQTLTHAVGPSGLIGGQALDLALENSSTDVTILDLETVDRCKTGALLTASIVIGYLGSSQNDPCWIERLSRFGHALGQAFQIQDDILDIESSFDVLGKPQGSDAKRHKPTTPTVMGMTAAKQKAQNLYAKAVDEVSGLSNNSLRDVVLFLKNRTGD